MPGGVPLRCTPDRTDPPALRQDPALPASLRQLVDLRSVAIAGQALAVAGAVLLGVSLPVAPMAIIIAALLVLNIVASARLKRGVPATHGAVAAQLALDLAAFTGLLLFAGGSANPVASIYLLHVVVIAMLLPWRSALAGTALVIACLALAIRFAEPLRHTDGQPLSEAALALGLWVSFALTAAVTAWFVIRIVASLREHDRLLQESARKALNDEAVNRLGTLAAGAAHELGTPLTTIAMIAGEMQREADDPGAAPRRGDPGRTGGGVPAGAVQSARGGGSRPRRGRRPREARRFRVVRGGAVPGAAARRAAADGLGRPAAGAGDLRRSVAAPVAADSAQQRGRCIAPSRRRHGPLGRRNRST